MAHTVLTSNTIAQCLVERVPALRPGYERLAAEFAPDSPPTHSVFYELVDDHVLAPVMEGRPFDERLLESIAVFFEEMASSDDDSVRGMLETAVFESIEGEPGVERVVRYFGPATMKLMEPFL